MKNLSLFVTLAVVIVCVSHVRSLSTLRSKREDSDQGRKGTGWTSNKGTPLKNDKKGDKAKPNVSVIKPHIIGGTAVALGTKPYHAGIRSGGTLICNGAIIGTRWILTIANCTRDFTSFEVAVGNVNSSATNFYVQTTSVKLEHQAFNGNNRFNDISLLKLGTPLTLGPNVAIIRLPSAQQYNNWDIEGFTVTITGFGSTAQTPVTPSTLLNSVNMIIMDHQTCSNSFQQPIGPKTFCTGPNATKNVCHFDGGAPAAIDESGTATLAGLMSYTNFTACLNNPAVFTSVARYIYWVSRATDGEVAVRS